MADIVTRYEDYLIEIKHASNNTVASYMRDIHQYASYLLELGSDVLDATQQTISEYVHWLQGRGKSPATVSRSLASLKSLYLFAVNEDEIDQNPVHNIKLEKAEKKLPQILSGKEVELLLEQPKCSDMKGYRDKAMLELLYATGIRVSELINLCMQALLDNGDEILIPAPDYPLWTATATLAGGNVVHYICDEQSEWYPDIDDIKSKITDKTKAIVIINPNNPTGAVYPKEILDQIVQIAREH